MSYLSSVCVPTRVMFVLLIAIMSACGGDEYRRGRVGESCQARNDCTGGLVCVRNVCVSDNSSLEVTGRSCYRVECATAGDCCSDFVPDPSCASLQADCQANPNNCLPYRTYCECNRACDDSLCVDTSPECLVDNHCYGIDTPYCVAESCVACRNAADCDGEGDQCIGGQCVAACTHDEECALLSSCVNGTCEETGCKTDLECSYLLGTANGECGTDRACHVRCTSNSECRVDQFEVCKSGECIFSGCNTDDECRAYLDLEYEPTNVTAECR